METALLRQEMLTARRSDWLGAISLATPLSRQLLTFAALVFVLAFIALLTLCSYARRERVAGVLVATTADGQLLARFVVPARAMGFVSPGDTLLLRFHAFPYQKFGLHAGTVTAVDDSAMSANTLAELGMAPVRGAFFRVDVTIKDGVIRSQGKSLPLRGGMTAETDLKLDSRLLIEWLFEPLYGLRQRSKGNSHD